MSEHVAFKGTYASLVELDLLDDLVLVGELLLGLGLALLVLLKKFFLNLFLQFFGLNLALGLREAVQTRFGELLAKKQLIPVIL